MAIEVPAPGQLVTVRNRRWVATDVIRGNITSSDTGVLTARATNLVTLVSIEDDARDDELRVIWELETGAAVHDFAVLPSPESGFDEPGQLDAFLHAVRWGAIASADKTALQAPFRSGVQIEDYQLDPVVRALSMPRINLLIADDVGLGKTIEAGLVMQEMTLRHRARTMLIVCPAGLTTQWHDEMRDKFGLDFRIVDSALLKRLRRQRGLYTNPWTHYPRLIVSIDWLKRERPLRLLREILPSTPRYPRTFDLLVVDEVHSCAPSGRGEYAVDSQRTKAIRTLAPHCEHRLFLSATPHNGYQESFTALLELLDPQRFMRGVQPNKDQLARVMVRRMKSELPANWDGTPRFGKRALKPVEVNYSDAERDAHELLNSYTASRHRTAGGKIHLAAADFVTSLLKRRMFSSPKAFADTVDTHLRTMSTRKPVEVKVSEKILIPFAERVDETAEDEELYRQAEEDALAVVRRCAPPLSDEERSILVRLRDWGLSAKDRPDAKFTAFLEWLAPIVAADERVIVFTEYRATQHWLYERLLAAGYRKDQIAQLYGGQDKDEREHIKDAFTDAIDLDPMRILLATDAASEGINLQWQCHRVLHWEIPWNPNRLEQRNGRVDRHGQKAPEVEIRHFVPAGWENRTFRAGSLEDELDFLHFAAKKVEAIREDLGSAGDVIATQVENKMLGRSADWRAADITIADRAHKAALKVQRDLVRELEKLTETLTGSRTELDLTPDTIERVVRTALRLFHHKDLEPATAPKDFPGKVFRLPELPGAWATARNQGLYHPLTRVERLVTFDQDSFGRRTDMVLLHLGHNLVRMCLENLREELWAQARAQGTAAKMSRVTARVLPGDVLRTPAVVAHGRVVVTGVDGARLHEEIMVAGGQLVEGKLVTAKQEDLARWLSAASRADAELVGPSIRERLTTQWPTVAEPLARALNTMAHHRTRSARSLLDQRCKEEIAAIGTVLDELERSIVEVLSQTDRWVQPSLFDDDERNQLTADLEALQARRDSIPQQREREIEALRARYAAPTTRWFPVAVEFLVPASIARGAC